MLEKSAISVFPKELLAGTLNTNCPRTLGLFAQTASFSRSQSYLILVKRYTEKNQQEPLKKILIDLYLNYEILPKNAVSLIPAWKKFLNDFRQLNGIQLINRLLATALLVSYR